MHQPSPAEQPEAAANDPEKTSSDGANQDQIFNVPNALSSIRLLMAFAVGILIELGHYTLSAVLFVIAVLTDAVDGWWARRFNQVTKLGRILDPFVDKIIITAALVALASVDGSRIQPWMVTLIIGREFLVTSLRAMVEGKGGDFSARQLGKLKMVVQSLAVVSSLCLLQTSAGWLGLPTSLLMWAALIITIASGADYVIQSIQLSRRTNS